MVNCMIERLEAAYVHGINNDEQTECIGVVFDIDTLGDIGYSVDCLEGTDEETADIIEFWLEHCKDNNAEQHIIDMLEDWKENGF